MTNILIGVALIAALRRDRSRDNTPPPPPPGRGSKTAARLLGVLMAALVIGSVAVATLGNIGSLPPTAFYNSAAQIIPVLIVALAVETRARDVWDAVPTATKVILIGSLVVAE